MIDMPTDRPRRRRTRLVAAPLGVAAVIALAACGSGTESSAAPSGAPASSADAQPADSQMAAFRTCLENNGVTLPERPSGGAGGAPPDGGTGGTPPSGAPTPPADGQGGSRAGGPGSGQAPPGVDATTWAAAQKACASLAPTPPNGTAPSGS